MTREELKKKIYKIPFKTKEEAKEYLKCSKIRNYKIKKEKDETYRVFLLEGGRDTGATIFKESFSVAPYVKIAGQLCYPPSVINRINICKSDEECSRILADARHGVYPKEEKK